MILWIAIIALYGFFWGKKKNECLVRFSHIQKKEAHIFNLHYDKVHQLNELTSSYSHRRDRTSTIWKTYSNTIFSSKIWCLNVDNAISQNALQQKNQDNSSSEETLTDTGESYLKFEQYERRTRVQIQVKNLKLPNFQDTPKLMLGLTTTCRWHNLSHTIHHMLLLFDKSDLSMNWWIAFHFSICSSYLV